MPDEKRGLLEVFPCCADILGISVELKDVLVSDIVANREKLEMRMTAEFPGVDISPAEKRLLEARIAAEYGLHSVHVEVSKRAEVPERKAKRKKQGKVLFGTAPKGKSADIGTLTVESGSVTVTGDVFSVLSREVQKQEAVVLCFEMTDYTGSIRVSKYIKKGEDRSVIDQIKVGSRVTVSGMCGYNRFEDDIVIEPKGISIAEKVKRQDNASSKRVELHLHTRFSAMDGLCDVTGAVKMAAGWGHKAVAITDHGVAHAFPEAWEAGKKHGVKIIFGTEGYMRNDVDDSPFIYGKGSFPLDSEFVAFDVETTGLSARTDRMTQIGAVVFANGKITETFTRFINPGIPIPAEITRLTGITDRDVFDAEGEGEVLRAFFEFAGNRPLVAHNAEFDLGFIRAACERSGIDFDVRCADTLSLSRALCEGLKRHSLDNVARYLSLPEFRHHRAGDDAIATARIMEQMIQRLRERGIDTLEASTAAGISYGRKASASRPRHIILLAKNKTGLKNLYKLISASHLEHFSRHPVIPKSLLMRHREGLIIGSACESGEIVNAIVQNRSDMTLTRLAEFYDYLEIQPVCNNAFLIKEGLISDEEGLRDINRSVVALAERLGKPVAATGDVHFLEPEHEIYRRVLLTAMEYPDADKELPIYFKTTDEMLAEFSYLGDEAAYNAVVGTPNMIADMCEDIELFPKQLFTPTIENSARELSELVNGRLRELYGENPPELVTRRLEAEMSDIIRCRYDVIYMSAQKLVSRSLRAGYLVGSRGSVGSSVAAFFAGITEVNALPAHYLCPKCKYSDFESGVGYGCGADLPDKQCPNCGASLSKDGFDIPFETFLGFNGDKIPDIDLNFSGEYQAQAHKATEELFGSDHVFRAGTIGTLANKTAYGYVKKYLEKRGEMVTKAEENRLIAGCVGVKRTTGQHPGGLVIIPQDMDVTDFCPVQHPADSKDSGVITTHFEYHSMENNLLKLDELGHDDPTTLKALEDLTGVRAVDIPLDEPVTMSIFKSPKALGLPEDDPVIGSVGTIGIPEFGTGFTRSMLKDTLPEEFSTLVRLSGFSHGTDVWLGNARDLITTGTATIKETIGCRDDIMLYLIKMGLDEHMAFAIMESVRKGRGLKPEWEKAMEKARVPRWYIDSCVKIKYLFPKAHASAYVMMAFRIAWFKVHRPLAYYAAHFYRRSDSFEASLMLSGIEPVRRKIRELSESNDLKQKEGDLLTTLESVYEFYLRGFTFEAIDLYESDATRFTPCGEKSLRPPFIVIAGLGETAARDLAAVRGQRVFVSEEDLLSACTKVSQTNIADLRAHGALGGLPETSQMSLF